MSVEKLIVTDLESVVKHLEVLRDNSRNDTSEFKDQHLLTAALVTSGISTAYANAIDLVKRVPEDRTEELKGLISELRSENREFGDEVERLEMELDELNFTNPQNLYDQQKWEVVKEMYEKLSLDQLKSFQEWVRQ